ncbi:MAG TPA: hypothetical protein VLH08_18600 [Acidobacteriota bacterium]|nr:hypothetical protein [Acidobacteriota bacterium]
MDYSSRIIKSPPVTIKEITSQESSPTPSTEQKNIQTGITTTKDSFDAAPASSIFSANPNTGQLNFGNGIVGKTPPTGSENIAATYRYQGLLQQSKTEISNFLKGEQRQGQPFKAVGSYLQSVQLASKEANLDLENKKIDAGMQEARERADNAMNAATTGMVIGVVQGGISIGAAADQLKDVASQAKGELTHLNDPAIESRYVRFTSLLTDLQKAVEPSSERKSDQVQKEINRQEQAINKAQTDSSDSSTETHRDQALDNIQKFLDILRQMNPQL